MTPIALNLVINKGITFNFNMTLRQDFSLVGSFTVNTSNNKITCTAHGLAVGDPVQFYPNDGASTLPSPIEAARIYYVKATYGADQFTISSEYNGAVFVINTDGTGTNNVFTSRPFDLTGWTVWAWVKQNPGDTLILDLAPEITDAALGQIDMGMTDEETFPLPPGNYVWDFILEDNTGVRIGPLLAGSCSIVELVTEPAEA